MSYQPFDIVMLRPVLGAKIYAIVAVEPHRPKHAYVAVRLDKGPFTKRYRLGDDQILAKIGTLDPNALTLEATVLHTPPPENWEVGQHYARYMAQQVLTDLDHRRWDLLANLKPGDLVAIRRQTGRGTRIELHRFLEVLPAGQKYHFTAVNPNGTVYKWTLDSLHLETESEQPLDVKPASDQFPERP